MAPPSGSCGPRCRTAKTPGTVVRAPVSRSVTSWFPAFWLTPLWHYPLAVKHSVFRRRTILFSASNTPFFGVEHLFFERGTPLFSAWNTAFFSVQHPSIQRGTLRFSVCNTPLFSVEHSVFGVKHSVFQRATPLFSAWNTAFFSMQHPSSQRGTLRFSA
jgi:hypothetical protein